MGVSSVFFLAGLTLSCGIGTPPNFVNARRVGSSRSPGCTSLLRSQFTTSSIFCFLSLGDSGLPPRGCPVSFANARTVGSSRFRGALLFRIQLTAASTAAFFSGALATDVWGMGTPVNFSRAKAVGSSTSSGFTGLRRIQFIEPSTIFLLSLVLSFTSGIPASSANLASSGSSKSKFGSFERSQFIVSSIASFLSSGATYPLVVGTYARVARA
mmetsp:Transcript_3840/g.8144  ORF Transcript_3840/g.8144 Transcript_3840/m.8144 type:complete len:213 (-) Transcript_3840:270-908(-)